MRSVHIRMSGGRALRALLAAALLAAVSGLAACAPAGKADGSVTLTFASWVPHIEQVVEKWNATHDRVTVRYQAMSGDDQTKVQTAIDAGAGPDVTQISQFLVPDYAISGRAAPIGEYVGAAAGRFSPAAWKSVAFGGEVYGVPQDTGPTVLYYRKDLFAQYGITVPRTWQEFRAAAEAVRRADPDARLTALPPNDERWWQGLLWQSGTRWSGIKGQSWVAAIDTPASQRVARYWQSLLDAGLVVPRQAYGPATWNAIQRNEILALSHASWFSELLATNAADQSGKWAVAPLPTWEGSEATGDTGGSANIVSAASDHPREAAEFALWLNTDPDSLRILIHASGLLPAATTGLDLAAAAPGVAYFGNQRINRLFVDAARRLSTRWSYGPGMEHSYATFTGGLADVVDGRRKLPGLMTEVQSATVALLTAKGLSVTVPSASKQSSGGSR
ncbi:extracellular solute-binding protein [Streptomyces sp. NPDC050315]|uniref:ABC transporter substrate-binding protein n=1 Tax=Streptomyces sp. NPDC050315 TaxID=3155039 RepID=UPI003440D799